MTDLIKRKAAMVGLEGSFSCRQSRDDAWLNQADYSKEMSKTIWVSFGNKEESCGFDFHKRLLINIIESCARMVLTVRWGGHTMVHRYPMPPHTGTSHHGDFLSVVIRPSTG